MMHDQLAMTNTEDIARLVRRRRVKRMLAARNAARRASSVLWWLLLAAALFALIECVAWSEFP